MISSWRDSILAQFTPQVSRLTLVADPDDLLTEELLLEQIRERGFDLIPFEDHVAFRFAYESLYRSQWDRGEPPDLIVVLRTQASDLRSLPYDLLHVGRSLAFSIADIFPNLSYPVVAALERGHLDVLYAAYHDHEPARMGDNSTKDFVLRYVFEIAPELIKDEADLLRMLLRRHHRGLQFPKSIDDRLVVLLRRNNRFSEWPLELIVLERMTFFAFLQERWPAFLDQRCAEHDPAIQEPHSQLYALQLPGPLAIPFGHDDVRVYIDNLFLERMLQPVHHPSAANGADRWFHIGIRIDIDADRARRLEQLVTTLALEVPTADARHQEWLPFAYRWGTLNLLWHQSSADTRTRLEDRYQNLQRQIDITFTSWMLHRYGGLHNQPAIPPAMVHHIPRVLARRLEGDEQRKIALVVIDGLALDQWILLRDQLRDRRPDIDYQEDATYAWVPTLTSVSRQATFAGKAPLYFPSSIFTTAKEPSLWNQFWVDHGLVAEQIGYAKSLGHGSLDSAREILSHPKVRVAGLVVDIVDKIMHGMQLGAAGMYNQIAQWFESGFMERLFDLLFEFDFDVYITADHGNVEATGCGRPSEGSLVEQRGERARIYSDASLRAGVAATFPGTIEWPPTGLPADFLPLLAARRMAFTQKDQQVVSHGGISIDEVIVPFIHIVRK